MAIIGQDYTPEERPQRMEEPQEEVPQEPKTPPLTIGDYGPILNFVFAEGRRVPFQHPEFAPFVNSIVTEYHGQDVFVKMQGFVFAKDGKQIELVAPERMSAIPGSAKIIDLDKQKS